MTARPDTDAVDGIQRRLAELHPDVDASAVGVTGRLLRLAQAFQRRRDEHLESFGLTAGDFDVLATVRRTQGSDGVKPRQLLRSVLITSGGLTKRLDRLENAGLLVRHPDPDDRRGTLIRLTKEGTALVDRAIPSVLTMERDLLSDALTGRQVDQTASLLRRLILTIDQ